MRLLMLILLLAALPCRAEDPPAIWEPGARLEPLATDGSGGEGPAWHPKLGVLTSGRGHVCRFALDGTTLVHRKDAQTNGLLLDAEGRLVACEPAKRRVTRTDAKGKIEVLADRYDGKRFNQPNDVAADAKGRLFFSDPCYGPRGRMEMKDAKGRLVEGVYRIDAPGKARRVLGCDEVSRPNGVLVSGNGKWLYVADNNNDEDGVRKLWRFALKDGEVDPKSRKLLYDWGKGRGPDGLKEDEKGRLYVAAGLNKPNPPAEPAKDVKGGIYVLSPEGKRLAFLAVPTDEVTNCAFGGKDRRSLYITAGGTLYRIRTATPGLTVFKGK